MISIITYCFILKVLSPWGEVILKCFYFFSLQKVESDLVFDDDNPSELNLILSGSKSSKNNRRVQSPSSTRSFPWKSSSNNSPGASASRNTNRFQWETRDKEEDGEFLGSIRQGKHKNVPQALRKRKPSSATSYKQKNSLPSGGVTDHSRRRTARVSDTDDEDLIYSGEDDDGSATRPGGVDIYVPSSTGRSDTGFERRN